MRPLARSVLTALALLPLLALGGPVGAEGGPPPLATVAALDWLEGDWKAVDDDGVFLAHYTSPAGGQVLSTSKKLVGERVVFFEFESFADEEGKVVLTPYPQGQRAARFVLEGWDSNKPKATFVNPKNDYPREIEYERVARDRLEIRLRGEGAQQVVVLRPVE